MGSASNAPALSLRLAALLELGATLTSERVPQNLLGLFCKAALEIMNVGQAAICLRGGDAETRFAFRNMAESEVEALAGIFDPASGLLRGRSASGIPFCSVDFHGSQVEKKFPAPLQRRFLVAPLLGSRSSGWLYLAGKPGDESFNDTDVQFAVTLAAQLVSGFENLILYQEIQQYAGQLELEIVERKNVAGKLREREAGLQRAQIMTKSAHVITGPDGAFESWSGTLPQLLGVSDAEMPPDTRTWLGLVHPDDRTKFRDVCIAAGRRGVRMDVEYRLMHTNGSWRNLRQVLEPLHHHIDAGGRMRWFNTIQDITEQVQLEETLREREAGLRRAQFMTKSAHVITGPDGEFISWSDTLPQLLGVDDAGMPPTTRKWIELIHPDDRDRFRNSCIQAGRNQLRSEIEYRLRRADGVWIRLRQVLEPLQGKPDAKGKVRWFNTIQDITEQREQQEKIARLSRISVVLSGINSAIVRLHDRSQLFQEACRVAVNLGALSMAWIGVIDRDTMEGKVVAHAGGEGQDLEQIRLTARADAPHADLPACIAVREMRPVVCNDVRAEPMPSWRGMELYERGHRSVAAWPLVVDNVAIGVIVLHAPEPEFFDADEMKLLNELAGDLSFGLQFIEREERLSYLACYDVLTGLPNRMLFHDRLSRLLLSPKQNGDLVAVIMIDLQHFAQLNDGLGRHAGDTVLREVAARLQAVVHEPGTLASISGGTFAIAVPELKQVTDAAGVLEKQVLEPFLRPFELDGQEIRIAVRAGIALGPTDGNDAETLFRHAEVALNKAKSSSEQYLFYAPQMNVAISARMALENDLQTALDARQFVIYYQPRVDLASGRIIAAEALVRWEHPERGLVSPVEFIPLAEETGLIVPIGAWVIEEVCTRQNLWLSQDVDIVPVAINLSTVQFKRGQILKTIKECISAHRMDPRHIEFELTESMVMDDPEQGSRNLRALKAMGLKLSLDDFGTGYSSLAYLKRFPFDFVKIDRAFVTDITRSQEDSAIATAIIAMAHSLNLKVVAEGVETREQLEYLRLHQCDQLQGYYFSEPVSAFAFEAMLRSGKRLQD